MRSEALNAAEDTPKTGAKLKKYTTPVTSAKIEKGLGLLHIRKILVLTTE